MLIINMLIPDLLNVLFDQCNYENMTMLRSLNKRRTNYANKYSLLRYYDMVKNTIKSMCERGNIKAIKHVIVYCSGLRDDMLEWSASNGNVLVVKYLVSIGANIHAGADCALMLSASNGHILVVKYLVSMDANIHAGHEGALIWSAFYGHLEVVKYLVSIGADIHACNNLALKWSVAEDNLEVVKYLVNEVGANIRTDNDELLGYKIIKDNFSHLFV